MKYKNPITYHSKDMANEKDLQMYAQFQGQGHKVKHYGTNRKVLSWGTDTWNMKALLLTI